MSVECLEPAEYSDIDPYHFDTGITILNELVADLHRHEDFIGEDRSLILGSTADDITNELLAEPKGKNALVNVLSEISTNLEVLVGVQIDDKEWCDPDESDYSGPTTVNADLNNYWEWKDYIAELILILTELLCVRTLVEAGQILYFTLVPVIDYFTGYPEYSYQFRVGFDSTQSFKNSFDDYITGGEECFGFPVYDYFVSLAFEARRNAPGACESGARHTALTYKEMIGGADFIWRLDSTNINSVDGTSVWKGARPRSGDTILSITHLWIRAFGYYTNTPPATTSTSFTYRFGQTPFRIQLNGVEIWSGFLTHNDFLIPEDINSDDSISSPRYTPAVYQGIVSAEPSSVPANIDLMGETDYRAFLDYENVQIPQYIDGEENLKRIGLNYGWVTTRPGKPARDCGILTAKVFRPAR